MRQRFEPVEWRDAILREVELGQISQTEDAIRERSIDRISRQVQLDELSQTADDSRQFGQSYTGQVKWG